MKKSFVAIAFLSSAVLAEIQPEQMGVTEVLPDIYPPHWIIVEDPAFFHWNDGKFIVLDADSDDPAQRYKGMFNGSNIAQFHQAKTKPEMYVVSTFYSRAQRGERTDVLTVYGKDSLAPLGEVIIPPKRANQMPTEYNLQLVDDEKLALVFNFTPAQSVSVIDLEARKFLSEIPIPGCALAYPMGGRAFASLCADGSMMSVSLDEDGQPAAIRRTAPFFDADDDPLIEKPAMHDGVGYFPTFQGHLYPIDLNGKTPVVKEPWSLVGDEEFGWRPGGLQLANTDSSGRLYILMHPDGGDGTHKNPGTEVWVFDTLKKERVDRIELQLPAISIALTRDEVPLLVATNINMEIDVYASDSGEQLRTLTNFGQETPFMLHGAR